MFIDVIAAKYGSALIKRERGPCGSSSIAAPELFMNAEERTIIEYLEVP
jgi:hypothetical protein